MTATATHGRHLTKASVKEFQDALSSMESAYLGITYDVDQWLQYQGQKDDYARECRRESRQVILKKIDDVADAAVSLLRIIRPQALNQG